MFAINHAASALLFKKHLKNEISFVWILIAVQFVEILWVLFNLLGIEKTTTAAVVHYVGDIHLSYMPYSHSLVSSLIISSVAGLCMFIGKKSLRISLYIVLAVLSHIILDILTHAPDIPLGFNYNYIMGLGLYSSAPVIAYLAELGFGIFCWWYYKGSRTLFWVITLFNMANLSMFLPAVKGLEFYMANRPFLLTTVIFFQILITLGAVGWAVKKHTKKNLPRGKKLKLY